jgi:hypothetical protein
LNNNFFDADSDIQGIVPGVAHFNCPTYGNNEENATLNITPLQGMGD